MATSLGNFHAMNVGTQTQAGLLCMSNEDRTGQEGPPLGHRTHMCMKIPRLYHHIA